MSPGITSPVIVAWTGQTIDAGALPRTPHPGRRMPPKEASFGSARPVTD